MYSPVIVQDRNLPVESCLVKDVYGKLKKPAQPLCVNGGWSDLLCQT